MIGLQRIWIFGNRRLKRKWTNVKLHVTVAHQRQVDNISITQSITLKSLCTACYSRKAPVSGWIGVKTSTSTGYPGSW